MIRIMVFGLLFLQFCLFVRSFVGRSSTCTPPLTIFRLSAASIHPHPRGTINSQSLYRAILSHPLTTTTTTTITITVVGEEVNKKE